MAAPNMNIVSLGGQIKRLDDLVDDKTVDATIDRAKLNKFRSIYEDMPWEDILLVLMLVLHSPGTSSF